MAFLLRGQLDDLRAAGSAPVLVLLAGGGSRPGPAGGPAADPPDRSDPVPAVVEPRDTAAAERAYREFRAARA